MKKKMQTDRDQGIAIGRRDVPTHFGGYNRLGLGGMGYESGFGKPDTKGGWADGSGDKPFLKDK